MANKLTPEQFRTVLDVFARLHAEDVQAAFDGVPGYQPHLNYRYPDGRVWLSRHSKEREDG